MEHKVIYKFTLWGNASKLSSAIGEGYLLSRLLRLVEV